MLEASSLSSTEEAGAQGPTGSGGEASKASKLTLRHFALVFSALPAKELELLMRGFYEDDDAWLWRFDKCTKNCNRISLPCSPTLKKGQGDYYPLL